MSKSNRIETVRQIILHRRNRLAGAIRLAFIAGVLLVAANAAKADTTEAVMLRPGEWSLNTPGYVIPQSLGDEPAQWPTDGWYRVTHKLGQIDVKAVPSNGKELPAFLKDIALQLGDSSGQYHPTGETEAEAIDTHYVRIPGVALVQGRLPLVKFSNHVLRPMLDHTYELSLGEQPFTLTVHNGLRNSQGVPYGQGAQYVVSYGDQTYTYQLGEQGWNSVLRAVTDLDGDGKPDFIVDVEGNSGAQEFLLLSSKATPGRNAPTATLTLVSQGGC